MTDRPIIFSAPMVKALVEGRKTMTRRIINPQPQVFEIDGKPAPVTITQVDGDPWPRIAVGRVITQQEVRFFPGMKLWVREAVACECNNAPIYRADLSDADRAHWKFRPSIHMPRWASRLTLIIGAVKIERLQDISLQDVWAEGCEVRQFWLFGADGPERQKIGARVFGSLWEELHGPGAWDANPWVVAITASKVIRANIDAAEARAA